MGALCIVWTAAASRVGRGVKSALSFFVDFALPPRCAGCGHVVAADEQICGACWQSLRFLTGSGCVSCGLPMQREGMQCAPCMQKPPRHDGAIAAVVYGGLAKDLALRLKHGRKIGLARLMARFMALSLDLEGGLVVPVPLHRWRLWRRGFNQSLLIARNLAAKRGLEVDADLLRRTRPTRVLGELGADARRRAVKGAFAVSDPSALAGRRTVILVDDVYTSGATADACAVALKRAGAGAVYVVTWARTDLEGRGPD